MGFGAWIGPYLTYFKGPGPGFEPNLSSGGSPGAEFGPYWAYFKPKSAHLGNLGLDLGHFGCRLPGFGPF